MLYLYYMCYLILFLCVNKLFENIANHCKIVTFYVTIL